MPVVLRQGALRVFFYSNEGDPREPAHVHVHGPGGKAKIWVRPVVSLAYNRGFDARTLRLVVFLVEAHRGDIERAWNEHFG